MCFSKSSSKLFLNHSFFFEPRTLFSAIRATDQEIWSSGRSRYVSHVDFDFDTLALISKDWKYSCVRTQQVLLESKFFQPQNISGLSLGPQPGRRSVPGGGDSQVDLKIPETTWQFYSSVFKPPGRWADLGKWRGLLVRSTDSPCQSTTLWRCCWDFAYPDRRWGAAVSLQLSEL